MRFLCLLVELLLVLLSTGLFLISYTVVEFVRRYLQLCELGLSQLLIGIN